DTHQPITTILDQAITEAVDTLQLPRVTIHLEHPADAQFGDYSTNVAMVLFGQLTDKSLYSNPRVLAQAIVDQLTQSTYNWLAKVEVAGPGFINFYLSQQYYGQTLAALSEGADLTLPEWQAKKVIVEFTDP